MTPRHVEGESFEVAVAAAAAEELLLLQDGQGTQLEATDISSMRKDIGMDKDSAGRYQLRPCNPLDKRP